jgi:uncharacterized repeat protein (TIGR03806 family)
MKEPRHAVSMLAAMMFSVLFSGFLFGRPLLGQTSAETLQVKAIDTSQLMGSPNPMPLTVEVAYPHLSFQRPLELTYAEDGSNRVYVVEQRGNIFVFENTPEARDPHLFLDIREVVSREGNEEGLLGLAFHPNYRENGEFYVYYSTKPRASIVSRFHVSPENPLQADRDSEEVLMTIDQPFGNHNGGCIRFGPDGYLYIGLGDGGAAHDPYGNGQDLSTLLGSVLRIDVDREDPGKKYAIPEDNPFVDREGARAEIWAYGVRNIWRLSFDRKTGDLWAGDVGQNRYEEVDLLRKGGNYGWKIREGFHSFAPEAEQTGGPLIDPLAEYFHSEGMSITGGMVYRGERLPEYEGAYFYADYVSGKVWILRYDGENVTENRQIASTNLAISAFGEDKKGNMYITAFDGKIYRFRPREIDLEAVRKAFPRKISEIRFVESLETLKLAAGTVPYNVNVPLWSDGAAKFRHLVLPESHSVKFDRKKSWQFPVGTVIVKDFQLDLDRTQPGKLRKLETRFFVHSPQGWNGYTYLWNDEETEAHLLEGAATKTYRVKTDRGDIDQEWYFPSRADCMACHTQAADFVLGPNTRQMNRASEIDERDRQLNLFSAMGVFAETLPEEPASLERYPDWRENEGNLEDRCRAYLDTNCSFCHQPGAVGGRSPDLRYHTPLEQANLIGRRPSQGQLGPEGTRLIAPGDPERSELLYRMADRGSRQMPPLATNIVDRKALDLLEEWITEMPEKK